ncbi:DUF4350 domain-containing protein [Microbacterium sp. Marseille-Q6965]|uniref:DUF4350 domain-containing protein n=1 Tax=Microbacterium sp. Marseille-Q6965 TaxID=2965072 RepID=UPI0021B8255A|nr:DUF4350 domain-containing protein [Microbacterium sp. Marseille-Q6965]
MTVIEAPSDPTLSRRRRVGGWIALIAAIVVVGTALAFVSAPEWRPKDAHDPESAAPTGALALARILEERGVAVELVHTRSDAERALDGDDTLVIGPTWYLENADLRDIAGRAERTVLIEPSSRDIELFFGDSAFAGTALEPVEPECALPEADRAGQIDPGRLYPRGDADVACYPGTEGGYGLLASEAGGAELVAIDAAAVFSNENLANGGNAALALNLLGAHGEVVWYLPSEADIAPGDAPDTLGALTPPWVTPAILLLAVTALAAALWQGRRFGPLVAEDLPVTVRGSETLEGRARLYQHARDPRHAADLLRRGAVERMARRLGLHRRTSVDEVAAAVSVRLGTPVARVHEILYAQPATDADLVAFGERLHDLETAIDSERNHP